MAIHNAWQQWDTEELRREKHDRLVERILPQEYQQWIYFTPEGEEDDASTDLR